MSERADRYAPLQERFGAALRREEGLARFTVARLGGPAEALLVANNMTDLTDAVTLARIYNLPWILLGSGTNVLVADAGFRGLVILNHAGAVRFEEEGHVIAESGANLSTLARKCMNLGLGGLEWAVNVPGTVGGAVVNNAGAHGGDMAQSVRYVEVFNVEDRPHVELWSLAQMRYGYRRSVLKGDRGRYVVLSTTLVLEPGRDPAALNAKADNFVAHRKRTQPPGASLGSVFKNPPGDFAGRLIEAAGLKGLTIGGVQVSPVHANFIVNLGEGTAADYRKAIEHVRAAVRQKFGITLELEIELIGDWDAPVEHAKRSESDHA